MPAPTPDELLPPTDSDPGDDADYEVEVFYGDPDAADTEEETTEAPEEIDPEDDEGALEDDEDEDDEVAQMRAEIARLAAQVNEKTREAENGKNQAYWNSIEEKAITAFEHDEAQIWARKDNSMDPDGYVREEMGKLMARVVDWYRRFYASQNESRAKAMNQARIPEYAARVASHFKLSPEGEQELMQYAPFLEADPEIMVREARKIARYEQISSSTRKTSQQASRRSARQKLPQITSGSGRAPARRVQAGSMSHLREIFAAANRG